LFIDRPGYQLLAAHSVKALRPLRGSPSHVGAGLDLAPTAEGVSPSFSWPG
jgi:hypothetical protein